MDKNQLFSVGLVVREIIDKEELADELVKEDFLGEKTFKLCRTHLKTGIKFT